MKEAEALLKRSEQLIDEIAAEMRTQHKLFIEAAKKRNPKEPIKGFNLEDIIERHRELQMMLEYLKLHTESIKTGKPIRPDAPAPVESAVPPPKPPVPPKR